MSLALSKVSIKTDWLNMLCFEFTARKPAWLLQSIPFAVTLSLTPKIMDKIKQLETEIADLELQAKETELAVNEALAQEWSFLARSAERRNDTSAMLRRMYEANTYAKLALDLKAELNNWK